MLLAFGSYFISDCLWSAFFTSKMQPGYGAPYIAMTRTAWLPFRYLAIDVFSGSATPVFIRHVTIYTYEKIMVKYKIWFEST
jgi:hypothetical protein